MNKISYEEIIAAAKIGETTDWEFKSAKGGFPGSFWETYSAMANTDGGTIVLGARENDDGVELDGLSPDQISHYKKILWDSLNNRNSISVNLLENHHVVEVPTGSGILLCITVPPASRNQRPVYRGTSPIGNTYRRNHEGDYRCSEDEVRRMFADSDPAITSDMRILKGFSFSDLDVASLKQYRQRIRSTKGDHAWLSLEDREFLQRLGGWRHDRNTDEEGLTVAGLLMFGMHQAIIDANCMPSYFVDYREKLEQNTRWSDRIYSDGSWESNLFQFYQRVWPKISSGLPVPFQLEQGVRRDETPAHDALREAFVNALIHTDFRAVGGVVIERYPDKFVFNNPGTLLVSISQYRKGGVSECRNKSLQTMFLMIGGGERAGSGVDTIRAGWKSRSWRLPLLTVTSQPDRVQLTLPMVSLIPSEVMANLNSQFGAGKISILSPAELQALATAQIEGAVSNVRLQELLAEHPVDISHMLQKLCEQKYLRSDNKKRWSSYWLSSESGKPTVESVSNPVASAQPKPAMAVNPAHSNVTTVEPASKSIQFNIQVDDGKTGAVPGTVDSSHSSSDWSHLEGSSSHLSAQKKKMPVNEMRNLILKLCAGKYLTLAEISSIVKRNARGLRNRYLTPMVKDGLLILRFPMSPNRPDQAYMTQQSGIGVGE